MLFLALISILTAKDTLEVIIIALDVKCPKSKSIEFSICKYITAFYFKPVNLHSHNL